MMNKNYIYFTILCALATLASFSSGTIEHSENGDLDGFWHLEQVDTLATGRSLNLADQRIFWGVQHKLISCASITTDNIYSFRGYYFRFEQTADSLILHTPYKNNWHQDQGANGGDIPATEVNDSIRSYGINQLRESFFKEKLKGDKMILRSKLLRLYFKKF